MSGEPCDVDLARLRRERTLHLRLLRLGTQTELEPFLRDALALMVEVAGAHQGYLELHDDEGARAPRWWIGHGFSADEIEGIRATTSQGIVAEALATGRTIVTPSALLDPRFRDRGSVRVGHIEAVICAPIGVDPPLGVAYLQRRDQPGAFPDEDIETVELFAQHLAPLADRLLAARRRQDDDDPTRSFRERLRAESVIGRSPALAAVLRQIALVSPLEVSVLLSGESGTGKSQLARVIHESGPRAGQPFVEVNCAALPETLLESELFGAMPGAHSTATRRIDGKVAAAERGTLFLDEVGDLSPGAQGKLLQLLQSKQYSPLGSARALTADVRLLAATNIDLQAAVRERRFREDLFYRLEVVPVRVPSLAERPEDVRELTEFFCARASERHRLPRIVPSRGAVRAVEAAAWPGNVRQLEHMVEAATIRAAAEGATQLERSHLFPDKPSTPGAPERLTYQEATRRFQARLVRDTLEDTGWNVVEAARRLDLVRAHVYNLIRAFGLTRQSRR
jgi:Nif-specific regulatory protein